MTPVCSNFKTKGLITMKKLSVNIINRIAIIVCVILSILITTMFSWCVVFKENQVLYAIIGVISIFALIVVILLLERTPSSSPNNTNETILKEDEKALDERDKQISKLNKENEVLKSQVSSLTNPKNEITEQEKLRKKCDAIEAFRDSFPYKISDTYQIYNIVRTELCVSTYSKWKLIGLYNGNLWEYDLMRPDTQSHKELLCLVADTHSLNELEELNIANQLLYN